jgi:hypothetical protein
MHYCFAVCIPLVVSWVSMCICEPPASSAQDGLEAKHLHQHWVREELVNALRARHMRRNVKTAHCVFLSDLWQRSGLEQWIERKGRKIHTEQKGEKVEHSHKLHQVVLRCIEEKEQLGTNPGRCRAQNTSMFCSKAIARPSSPAPISTDTLAPSSFPPFTRVPRPSRFLKLVDLHPKPADRRGTS